MSDGKSKKNRVAAVMVQGTSSHVGKSVLTAALCRIFSEMGLRAAPFKAQNMALNSHVTADGAEIGVAQAFQAEAAGTEPTADMNPILLKPTGDSTSQVVIHGRVHGVMSATEYHAFKKEARRYVVESWERLSAAYDVVVVEGAGSPAEVNLRDGDLANMGVAEIIDCPVLLAGDIDRGGVFASLVGTMELLTPGERARVKGFIINKFRGDIALLKPGLDFLEEKTGVPVLGVVPYLADSNLPDEDSVALEKATKTRVSADVSGMARITVIRLPRISNFTDFDPFRGEPAVELSFADTPAGVEGSDLVIIPGSKNTVSDLLWMRERGIDRAITDHHRRGGMVAGICGGFQMLGLTLADPHGVESAHGTVPGLGLLSGSTVMEKAKETHRVRASATVPGSDVEHEVSGYEIHMGSTTASDKGFARISLRGGTAVSIEDGAVSGDGRAWGTYIHGIFDNDGFRDGLVASLLSSRGAEGATGATKPRTFREARRSALDALARTVRESMDMERLYEILSLRDLAHGG